MIRLWVGKNVYSGEVQGGAEVLKRRVGVMRSFCELESGIFELHDLRTSEVGTNLHRLEGRDRRSFLVSREFIGPFAT